MQLVYIRGGGGGKEFPRAFTQMKLCGIWRRCQLPVDFMNDYEELLQ